MFGNIGNVWEYWGYWEFQASAGGRKIVSSKFTENYYDPFLLKIDEK